MSNPPDNNGSPTESTPTSYTLPNHNKATHAAPRPAHPYINPYPYPNRAYPNQWNPSQAEHFPRNSVSPTQKPTSHILTIISFCLMLIGIILESLALLLFLTPELAFNHVTETIVILLILCPILHLTGVILGIVALIKINSHPEWGGKGMAVASMAINLVIITHEASGNIVLLLDILFITKLY